MARDVNLGPFFYISLTNWDKLLKIAAKMSKKCGRMERLSGGVILKKFMDWRRVKVAKSRGGRESYPRVSLPGKGEILDPDGDFTSWQSLIELRQAISLTVTNNPGYARSAKKTLGITRIALSRIIRRREEQKKRLTAKQKV